MTVEQVAMVCHEANRAYCGGLGDHSQVPWGEAPEWQQNSAVCGVLFHLENPDSKPSDSHDNWLLQKKMDGWVYGPVKDTDKKEHPCMVPYEELPAGQRRKDSLFIGIVKALS